MTTQGLDKNIDWNELPFVPETLHCSVEAEQGTDMDIWVIAKATINLADTSLSELFDSHAISDICLHIYRHMIDYLWTPFPEYSLERRALHHFLINVQSRMGLLGNMVTKSRETYNLHFRVNSVAITTERYDNDGENISTETLVFGTTRVQLSQVCNPNILRFLVYLLNRSIENIKGLPHFDHRFDSFAEQSIKALNKMAIDIEPIVNLIQPWPSIGNPRIVSAEILLDIEKCPS